MSELEYINTIELPTWAASYLVNGDSSGLEDNEIELVDTWADSLEHNCLVFDFGGSEEYAGSGFTHYPEFGLPCDCEEVKLYGHAK